MFNIRRHFDSRNSFFPLLCVFLCRTYADTTLTYILTSDYVIYSNYYWCWIVGIRVEYDVYVYTRAS